VKEVYSATMKRSNSLPILNNNKGDVELLKSAKEEVKKFEPIFSKRALDQTLLFLLEISLLIDKEKEGAKNNAKDQFFSY
tara:strand:- start:110 stop:349 length:240 start_codon:yes stop_codon:yes gene_type:complete